MLRNITKNQLIQIIKYPFLLLFSFVYLLVFSLWTTPLYKDWYGCDASFFTMAGRGILKGWVPYKDFFDLKGPYFFFLQAFGQLFAKARMGAFIIQIFALFFSLVLIIKLAELFLSTKSTCFVVFIFLAGHIATLWGGNTLEEYALVLSLLCLYLSVRDIKAGDSIKIRWTTALITGVSFGVILFSKITVAAPIIGIAIAIIFFYLINKDFKNLLLYIAVAFAGFLIAVIPVFIYFGLHNNIKEMLYSVFIFAFKRSVDYSNRFNLRWELKISGCYFAIIFSICQLTSNILDSRKNNSDDEKETKVTILDTNTCFYIIILLMGIITALALHLGDPFIYYFTTGYPCVLFSLIMLLYIGNGEITLFKSLKYDIPIAFFALSMCYFASFTASTLSTVIYDRKSEYYGEYVRQAKEMASFIPGPDRDQVYSFNVDMQWFECNQILPCYKYQVNLQFFVALDNRIQTDILNYLRETPPKWIVVGGDLSTYLPTINELVVSKYENIYTNDYASLYLLQ